MCGTLEREWDADPNAYLPTVHKCRGCELRSFKQDEVKDAASQGLTVRLVRSGSAAAGDVLASEAAAYRRDRKAAREEKAAKKAAKDARVEQRRAEREAVERAKQEAGQ